MAPLQDILASWPSILFLTSCYYATLWSYRTFWRLPKGTRLPPGPRGPPFIGNFYQIPRGQAWLGFTSWAKEYGPIFYFSVLGSRTVVINSAKVATHLLEGRSTIYSDRPHQRMATLAGRGQTIFLASTRNPRFKALRRVLNTGLNARAARSYEPIQTQELTVLLKSLLATPEQFQAHIRRNSVAIILKVAYGYEVGDIDDPLVNVIAEGFRLANQLQTPGKFLVEFFPLHWYIPVRFLPEWLPGAGFKRLARECGKEMSRIDTTPFLWAKGQLATGDYVESFVSKHLLGEDGLAKPDVEHEDIVRWASAALYVGGGDTTISTLTTFCLLMAMYPDVQRRAQEDIERVAPGRLPTLDDYPDLPYIKALLQEVMRWGPALPLGLPHRVTEDDVYQDYFIPEGTRILANVWAISRDEETYPDPFTFDPSRHLGPNPQVDPFKFVFGFGKRICPGAHLAEMTMFLNIANILALFNIRKPLGPNGKEIEPPIEWSVGITVHLKPFPLSIVPRSKESAQLIERLV